jgi:hypothetical protein
MKPMNLFFKEDIKTKIRYIKSDSFQVNVNELQLAKVLDEIHIPQLFIDKGQQIITYNNEIITPYQKVKNHTENFYIHHPSGNNNSPDYLVMIEQIPFFMEAKSSSKGIPIWNTGYPKPGVIYIFTSKKYPNDCTYFLGDRAENLLECIKQVNLIRKDANEQAKSCIPEDNFFNISVDFRLNYKQNDFDFFQEDIRRLLESEVEEKLSPFFINIR